MWGNFGDLTKKLAEKAAAAAENIEGQLNESVGASDAIADLKKTSTSNVYILPPTNEHAISDDEDPFNENDDFYGDDGSFDVDMYDKVNENSEEHKEESLALANEQQDVVTSGDQFTVNGTVEDIDNIEECQPSQEAGIINGIQEVRSDIQDEGIYDEGIYDDEEDEEQEEQEAGSDYFGETQKDQGEKLLSIIPTDVRVEESQEVETETAIDNEQQFDTDTTFDDEHNVHSIVLKEEVEEPKPSIIRVDESTIKRDMPSPPKGTETIRNILSKAAAKLHNLQNDDDADHDMQMDTGFASVAKERALVETQDETSDMIPIVKEEAVEISRELSDISPIEEVHIDINNERGDIVPVTPNKNKEAQIEALTDEIYQSDGEESIYVTKEEAHSLHNRDNSDSILRLQLRELQNQLARREEQLTSKSAQIVEMMEMQERDKSLFELKIKETKEEAKKRISKAREKVDDTKAKLADANAKLADANARANCVGSTSDEQEVIIAAYIEEGEKLARKQSEMEFLVREARGDMRDLKKELETERSAKEIAEGKITELDIDLESTKTQLAAAKQKGGLADKLDSDLLAAKEEREKNASIILGLEAKLKESKACYKELQKEMGQAFEDKVAELEQETASIRNEKDSILQDLETKLRTSEREANFREDSLRYEVAELRKRWQEAVRRCDALSIDLQQSSAPLLRQVESTERQSRARAAAWADLETRLRFEIEEQVIEKEKLQKDRNELEVDAKKATRALTGKESELAISQSIIEDLNTSFNEFSARYESTVSELESLKIEYSNLQHHLKDIELNVRTEFLNTLRENEERFNDQVESLEVEVRQERDRRKSLEEKIQVMMDTAEAYEGSEMSLVQKSAKSPKRNLGSKANQADILQDTLVGIDPDGDDDVNITDLKGGKEEHISNGTGSFAFIEQLSQALKATKSEMNTLRKQLDESEDRRGVLENEAVASEESTRALPLLRAQSVQLTREVNERDMEIQALQEDINEVRDIYKSQLNALLGGDITNGSSTSGPVRPSQLSTVTAEVVKPAKKTVIPSSFTGMRTF